MKNFMFIGSGINVEPINLILKQNPDLWDENRERRDSQGSPHSEMNDIWVRYNDQKKFKESGDWSKFNQPHFPIWYPAARKLHYIRPLAISMMAKMGSTHLGGILITRIPAGGKILPHVDDNWHSRFYNCKLYIPIQTNINCWNRCGDEVVTMNTGDCWYFNNAVEHEVQNQGSDERITLILCMKTND